MADAILGGLARALDDRRDVAAAGGVGLHLLDGRREEAVPALLRRGPVGLGQAGHERVRQHRQRFEGRHAALHAGRVPGAQHHAVERGQSVDLLREIAQHRVAARVAAHAHQVHGLVVGAAIGIAAAHLDAGLVHPGFGAEVQEGDAGLVVLQRGVGNDLDREVGGLAGLVGHVDELDARLGRGGAQRAGDVLAVARQVDTRDAHADVVLPADHAGRRAALVPQHFPKRIQAPVRLIRGGRDTGGEHRCQAQRPEPSAHPSHLNYVW